ncbi:MAG: regulatory protein RecX [Bacteroidales bacterium]|nr:RecX family transcriptional regulator [Lentimicrobiaceae bacterium]MDD5694092.1 regulatory protein RecX [Bacteroidales bacterium]
MHQDADDRHKELLQKAQSYCARDEKCRLQVKHKLIFWGATSVETEDILDQLMDERYIDEERFAREFAQGKFRINKWGKVKIALEMARLQIPQDAIHHGLDAIDPDDYLSVLRKILLQRLNSLHEKNKEIAKKKLATFALGKGFEGELVWRMVREMG